MIITDNVFLATYSRSLIAMVTDQDDHQANGNKTHIVVEQS